MLYNCIQPPLLRLHMSRKDIAEPVSYTHLRAHERCV